MSSDKIIVCFSGTGNSYYLANELKEKLGYDKVLMMTNAVADPSLYGDPKEVGLVYPTYISMPPIYFRIFVDKVMANPDLENLEYLFQVTDCASLPGKTLNIAERLLGYNNYYVTYSATVKMINTYVPLGKIPNDKKIQTKYAKADLKLDKIVADIKANKTKLPHYKIGMKRSLNKYMNFCDEPRKSPFIIGTECNQCGICIETCPSNAIELVEGKVTFKEGCNYCWGCYHRCPKHAIKYEKLKDPTYYQNEKAGFNLKYRGKN